MHIKPQEGLLSYCAGNGSYSPGKELGNLYSLQCMIRLIRSKDGIMGSTRSRHARDKCCTQYFIPWGKGGGLSPFGSCDVDGSFILNIYFYALKKLMLGCELSLIGSR
jgi:hypothetical protein